MMEAKKRKIAMVVNKFDMHEYDQSFADLEYWLSRSPQERLAAVTSLIQPYIKGKRMDKTCFGRTNY